MHTDITIHAVVFVADLARLLPIISNYEKQYKPLSIQCYWFSNIIYECIVRGVLDSTQTKGFMFTQMAEHLCNRFTIIHYIIDIHLLQTVLHYLHSFCFICTLLGRSCYIWMQTFFSLTSIIYNFYPHQYLVLPWLQLSFFEKIK